jgi:hypothetical protein
MDLKKGLSALVFSGCLLVSSGCGTFGESLYEPPGPSFHEDESFAEMVYEQIEREALEKNRAEGNYSVE